MRPPVEHAVAHQRRLQVRKEAPFLPRHVRGQTKFLEPQSSILNEPWPLLYAAQGSRPSLEPSFVRPHPGPGRRQTGSFSLSLEFRKSCPPTGHWPVQARLTFYDGKRMRVNYPEPRIGSETLTIRASRTSAAGCIHGSWRPGPEGGPGPGVRLAARAELPDRIWCARQAGGRPLGTDRRARHMVGDT